MSSQHETVWLGRGGQGAFTAARLLGLSAVRFGGRQALAFPSFGPERRGAPVFAYTRIADTPVTDRSAVRRADVAVVLDESLLTQVATSFLHEDTLLIVDSAGSPPPASTPKGRLYRFDARSLAREILGTDHSNTILLGVLVGLTGLVTPQAAEKGISAKFGTGARAQKNLLAFRHALAHGKAESAA